MVAVLNLRVICCNQLVVFANFDVIVLLHSQLWWTPWWWWYSTWCWLTYIVSDGSVHHHLYEDYPFWPFHWFSRVELSQHFCCWHSSISWRNSDVQSFHFQHSAKIRIYVFVQSIFAENRRAASGDLHTNRLTNIKRYACFGIFQQHWVLQMTSGSDRQVWRGHRGDPCPRTGEMTRVGRCAVTHMWHEIKWNIGKLVKWWFHGKKQIIWTVITVYSCISSWFMLILFRTQENSGKKRLSLWHRTNTGRTGTSCQSSLHGCCESGLGQGPKTFKHSAIVVGKWGRKLRTLLDLGIFLAV